MRSPMAFRTQFACGLAMLVLLGVSAYQCLHRTNVRGEVCERPGEVRKFASDVAARHEYLCRFDGVVLARIHTRREIIEGLAAGRMSLFEAAARFKRLNSELNPSKIDVWHIFFRGATDNERVCWQVISWFDTNTSTTESHRQQILWQAEAELSK